MTKFFIPALLSLATLNSACKKDDPLAGFDTHALFAQPTLQEIEAVRTNWAKRDLNPGNVTVEATYPINSKTDLKIISYHLAGFKQYAGVLLPQTAAALPVRMYISGFALEDAVNHHNVKVSATEALPFVYVVPALRGQSLAITVNDIEYKTPTSEGTRNDAFDAATDDAIAGLNAVGTIFKESSDTSKVVVQGGSRGGTVALLMAERDKRVKLAVGVAFPADLISLTASHQRDTHYRFQFLDALINGSASFAATREKLIASSPLFFFRDLPKTQIHFGRNDVNTPAVQGEALFNAMKDAGRASDMELFIYPNRDHYNIGQNNSEMQDRIEQFFKTL